MKKSFFERLTGSHIEEETKPANVTPQTQPSSSTYSKTGSMIEEMETESNEEGQLAVDVYQTPTEIIIKAIAPGVNPEDLDVTITSETITLKGKREQEETIEKENYFYQELYWGAFGRSIVLPQEIDPEEAQAEIKKGVLVIRLPKLDKGRTQKLKVKNG